MRVLIANGLPWMGGAERWTAHVARGLSERGHGVTAACPPASGLSNTALGSGATVLPWTPRTGRSAGLARAIVRGRFDVVVSTVRGEHRRVGLAARRAGLPGSVARLMSGWTPDGRAPAWRRALRGSIYRRLVLLGVANSEAGRREVVRQGILPAGRVATIRNGVDLARFDPDRVPRGRFRAELGIPADHVLVVSVSRFVERKGQPWELAALGPVVAARSDVHVVFVGPCREEERAWRGGLVRRASGFPGAARIRFLEERPDVPVVLADADLLVRGSVEEGLPNIVLEALAMRVPVVATGICGTPEAVVDGTTGRLVPPRDPAALRRAVLDLLRAPASRRGALGEAGRERVERLFGMDRMVEEYERLFERAASAGRRDR
ncbi:MAG TPA: glycosyltransferase family 4 protein [Gemmatimonadota bacterium]|nr:glycosyltransferase family 4 protein [Gemmatimonadota bacterium]